MMLEAALSACMCVLGVGRAAADAFHLGLGRERCVRLRGGRLVPTGRSLRVHGR